MKERKGQVSGFNGDGQVNEWKKIKWMNWLMPKVGSVGCSFSLNWKLTKEFLDRCLKEREREREDS